MKRNANLVVLILALSTPLPALAYVGPGGGLTAIGAFLAALVGLVVAAFGFLWFPIKRMRKNRRERAGRK
jgi:hypothetical protein